MRIDMFAHGLPSDLRSTVLTLLPDEPSLVNWRTLTPLFDMSERLALLDRARIDVQILTAPSPPLEELFGHDKQRLRQLVILANDSMAEIVSDSSGRFRGTVTIPLSDPEFAVYELHRGVNELGLLGPQLFTSTRGIPLDDQRNEPIWREIEMLGVPVWLHPERSANHADYQHEPSSLYGLYMVLGWPYETSLAVMRLVLSGVTKRYSGIRFLVHHAGGMLPFFARRIETSYPGSEVIGRIGETLIEGPPARFLKRFYVDTAIHGPVSALMCAYDFFGPENIVIGTDAPFGPMKGLEYSLSGCEIVDAMPIGERERELIRFGNALKLCGLDDLIGPNSDRADE